MTDSKGNALVMGLGLFGGGVGAARHLIGEGWTVMVTDLQSKDELGSSLGDLAGLDCEFRLGGHEQEDFSRADLVVVNPAVPPSNRFLQVARENGARLTSELELFMDAAPCRLVLITGTAGKSSSTSFLVNLLQAAEVPAWLGGNIGGSLLQELPKLRSDHVVCLEVSSYQLEALDPEPRKGIELVAITNLSEDHLERHGTPKKYAQAKARILSLADPAATAVLPKELRTDPIFTTDLRCLEHPGNGREANHDLLDSLNLPWEQVPHLPAFQWANVRLAVLLAHCLGLERQQLETGLVNLSPPPHRAEELGRFAGVRVVDNGVATTPEATLAVLEGEAEAVTLILGGQPKRDLAFDELLDAVARRGDRLVLFGAATEAIAQACDRHQVRPDRAQDFEQAVRGGLEQTPPGGTLLFSPGCASFDTHQNFKHRAQSFRKFLPAMDS